MIAVIHVMMDEMSFSDSTAYLTYIDTVYFFRPSDWFLFEPISKTILIVFRSLTRSTESTVAAGHYFISLVYIFSSLVVFPPRQGNWRGLLIAFALYGPQLAFVTIRATPAYFIASLAVIQASRGLYRSFVYSGLAACFHVSAILALIPIASLFLKSKLRSLEKLQNPKILFSLLLIASVLFFFIGRTIFSTAQLLFSYIPYLGKYLVFAVGLSDAGGVANTASNYATGHFVLLGAISIFSFGFITIKDPMTRSVGVFVIVSYILYLFVFFAFSPIAAFRQTPFWILPAFSLFPWDKIGWRGIGHLPFLTLVFGIFVFQFVRVI